MKSRCGGGVSCRGAALWAVVLVAGGLTSAASASPGLPVFPEDGQIESLRLFAGPLRPVDAPGKASLFTRGAAKTQSQKLAENRDAADVLRRLQQSRDPHATSDLDAFLAAHPDSRWAPSLRLERGRRQFRKGFFAKADADWLQLWDDWKDSREAAAVETADEALAKLLESAMGAGDAKLVARLLGEQEDRPGNGCLQGVLWRARKVEWLLKHTPAQNVMCGPRSLYAILQHQGKPIVPVRLNEVKDDKIATGLSLTDVQAYAARFGMPLVAVKRGGAGAVPTPCVMHQKRGHYAALLAEENGRYLLDDRSLEFKDWVELEAVEAAASGYFLVAAGAVPDGWSVVDAAEAAGVFGRDGAHGVARTSVSASENTPDTGGAPSAPGPDGGWGAGGGAGDGGGDGADGWGGVDYWGYGMEDTEWYWVEDDYEDEGSCLTCGQEGVPAYGLHPQIASLVIGDQPVGYDPPVGPHVWFTLSYNDRDDSLPAAQPTYANVGKEWVTDWTAFVEHLSASPYQGQKLTVHLKGGGIEESLYTTSGGCYGPNDQSMTRVYRAGRRYERVMSNGTREIYDQPDNTNAPVRIFLSRVVDPQGNVLSLGYSGNGRLASLTDAIGQVTTLSYTNTDIWKITGVTDPFGRQARLGYDGNGRLSQVTDIIGMTSRFVYGASGQITQMITPYGTTTFARVTGPNAWDVKLTVTDPEGEQEMIQYVEPITVPAGFYDESPPRTVQVGSSNVTFLAENARMEFRNTFYWDRQAMREGPGDISKATQYRWYTDADWIVVPVLEAIKRPLEGRIWFNYPGTSASGGVNGWPAFVGGARMPTKVLRMVDGKPQISQRYYNAQGRLTREVDPLGRQTEYRYATNHLDVTEIRQRTATGYDVLAQFVYNAQRLPTRITFASGQSRVLRYNSRGQVTNIVDALGNVTAYEYDANGYRVRVDGPLAGADDSVQFSYDARGRLSASAWADGTVYTNEYDNFDRLVRRRFPDGTSLSFEYQRLDRTASTDRQGRTERVTYDRNGRMRTVTDALGRVNRYDWCECGSLDAITDALGRRTQFVRDVQGRLLKRVLADGSAVTYTYHPDTGQLQSVCDSRGMLTVYERDLDETMIRVDYPNSTNTPAVYKEYDPYYGRLTLMEDGMGQTHYTYHPVGQPGAESLATVTGPRGDIVRYQYDANGELTNRTANGVGIGFVLDPMKRAQTVRTAAGAFAYSFDPGTHRPARVDYPNGEFAALTYGSAAEDHELRSIEHRRSDLSLLTRHTYAYAPDGIVTSWVQQVTNASPAAWSLRYDAADQIVSARRTQSGAPDRAYAWSYDAAGNRLTDVVNGVTNAFSYNALNELIRSGTGTAASARYQWDGAGRLVRMVRGAEETLLSYDGMDRCVAIREVSGGSTVETRHLVWAGTDLVAAHVSNVTTRTVYYYPLAQVTVAGATTTAVFYACDHQGSVRLVTDAAQQAIERHDASPWGVMDDGSGRVYAEWAYAGLYRHERSGLLLGVWRAYDPGLGRWLSRDPIEEAGGLNLYAYAGNSPVSRVDPAGARWVQTRRPSSFSSRSTGRSAVPQTSPVPTHPTPAPAPPTTKGQTPPSANNNPVVNNPQPCKAAEQAAAAARAAAERANVAVRAKPGSQVPATGQPGSTQGTGATGGGSGNKGGGTKGGGTTGGGTKCDAACQAKAAASGDSKPPTAPKQPVK